MHIRKLVLNLLLKLINSNLCKQNALDPKVTEQKLEQLLVFSLHCLLVLVVDHVQVFHSELFKIVYEKLFGSFMRHVAGEAAHEKVNCRKFVSFFL